MWLSVIAIGPTVCIRVPFILRGTVNTPDSVKGFSLYLVLMMDLASLAGWTSLVIFFFRNWTLGSSEDNSKFKKDNYFLNFEVQEPRLLVREFELRHQQKKGEKPSSLLPLYWAPQSVEEEGKKQVAPCTGSACSVPEETFYREKKV